MSNSTHRVEVFRVEHLEKHPNADKLSIMRIFDAYQAVVRIEDYKIGDLACYVPPDNILPDKPEYSWLKGKLRIKATKLRGIVSQGLVLECPSGFGVGDDVAEFLGITHYVPQPGSGSHGPGGGGSQGQVIADPPFPGPNYDIDSWFRYGSLIPEGTMVELTEKLHGANTRATYQDGAYWMGSRNHFHKPDKTSLFWRVFHKNPWLKRLCKRNPGYVVYGETFGNVQDLKYGMQTGEDFRVFDIWTGTRFLNCIERTNAMRIAMIPTTWEKILLGLRQVSSASLWGSSKTEDWTKHYVPILDVDLYSKELINKHMNGPSLIPGADHVREGVVIKPIYEMWNPHIGRLVLKAVSPDYLGRP